MQATSELFTISKVCGLDHIFITVCHREYQGWAVCHNICGSYLPMQHDEFVGTTSRTILDLHIHRSWCNGCSIENKGL